MELKLNVYKGKSIEKTYTTDDFCLMTGTCEDILNTIQIDKLGAIDLNSIDDNPPMEFLTMFFGLYKQFNPIMKELFDGITDDEYKRTHIDEVARVAWQVIMYTLTSLFNITGTEKN